MAVRVKRILSTQQLVYYLKTQSSNFFIIPKDLQLQAVKEINRIHIIIFLQFNFAQNNKLNKNSSRMILYISTLS
jgi:hypothetical protein